MKSEMSPERESDSVADTVSRIGGAVVNPLDPWKSWQTLSGRVATLDGDGRTFDEIAQERQEAGL